SKRLITTRAKSKIMLDRRTRLNSLLECLDNGSIPESTDNSECKKCSNDAKSTKYKDNYSSLHWNISNFAKGKSTHFVLASFDCFFLGHSMQLAEPWNRIDCTTRTRDTLPTTRRK
ncbi:hypothetical protein OS493_039856, partial [Desmophyllum pertusum]